VENWTKVVKMEKKTIARFLIVLFFAPLLLFAAFSDAQSLSESWPMFHQNLERTGYLETSAPVTNQTLWKFNTGGQVGSPTVVNGVVYVGSYDRKIYAFNAFTGALTWSYMTGGAVISRPAVADGKIFVGSEDNKLYALNASNGNHVWNYTTGYYVDSDPTVANGIVYVGSEDKKVYALNATTGEHIWSYTTDDQIMLSSTAVSEGIVYIGSLDHKVYALNAFTWAH